MIYIAHMVIAIFLAIIILVSTKTKYLFLNSSVRRMRRRTGGEAGGEAEGEARAKKWCIGMNLNCP